MTTRIAELLESYQRGVKEPLGVVETCLARIDRFEDTIRAWVSVDRDEARRQAESIGRRIKAGSAIGKLAGIPIGIKDIFDIVGQPTRAGSQLRANHRAMNDAPVVNRLRLAGAIILGKTVTTEFACFDPPPTRNPWNPERTPGGSSSGSAAAVAMGMCIAALGSQTGGSIVRPASYCGVAGFKPTIGMVNTQGVVPISSHLDHVGPIANAAADLEYLFRVISEIEPATPVSGWRAVYFKEVFHESASPAVVESFERALMLLSAAGRSVEIAKLPASFHEMPAMHLQIMGFDMARDHGEVFTSDPNKYGPKVGSLIESGFRVSQQDYQQALAHQELFRRQMSEVIPMGTVALMPSTTTTAPDLSTTGNPQFNAPWSYSGFPSATIPCGLDADGMPCGLQIVGRAGDDLQVLQAAQIAEDIIQFHSRPPILAID